MKKISKLLAVVLAVAMLICPAMCLTSMAETSTDAYTLNYADGVLTVNVAPGEDFLVSLLKIDIEGYVVDEDNIAVTTEEGVSFSANPSYENGVLTLLLASKEAANVHLVSSATVTIPATKDESASKYYIALTNIQVATTGTADAPDSFIAIDGVNADGAVANVVPVVNETAGPAVDSRLKVAKISLAYGTSSLELNFRIVTKDVLNLYPKMEFVIIPQKYNKDTLNLETAEPIVINSTDLVTAGKYSQYTYKDIQLYELALEIEYIIKGYDANGNLVAVSDAEPFTAVGDLKGQIEDPNKTEEFKRLMVDTLVVCDEVMDNVAASYPNSSLASYVATNSVLDGIDTSLATQTIKTPNKVDNFNSYDSKFTQASSATHRIRSSVAIGKVPYINFRIKDSKGALDRSKLSVTVSYTSKDSSGEHPYSKTFGAADFTDAGDYINLEFAEIGFHDSNKDIVFTVVYDGKTVCDWTYSIETYLNSKQTDATIGAQSIALIKLGQSFRTYQKLD